MDAQFSCRPLPLLWEGRVLVFFHLPHARKANSFKTECFAPAIQIQFCTQTQLDHASQSSTMCWKPNRNLQFLPEPDTRLILCGDKARSEPRLLPSLFRLRQETEGPPLDLGPGVFLKPQESGLDMLLPEGVADFEAEPCGKKVRP